jgi:hypothetical protein
MTRLTQWFLKTWLANGIANLGTAIRKAQIDTIFRDIDGK